MSKLKKTSKILLIVGACLLIAGGIILAIVQATEGEGCTSNELTTYIKEDIASVKDTLPDSTFFAFYEVETVLNGTIDSLDSTNVRISDYKIILQSEHYVYTIHRDMIHDTRDVVVDTGHWGGCFPIDTNEFPITFIQAFDYAKNCAEPAPKTKYMTIRHPMGVTYLNPNYFFGNVDESGMAVDAITGEVTKVE